MRVGAKRILLVEDNAADVVLFREALEENGFEVDLRIAGDGPAAEQVLADACDPEGWSPEVIVLDLNLPRGSGFDVLEHVKGLPELCDIPVVVLTSSQTEEDVRRAYSALASAFVTKPVGLEPFHRMVRVLGEFWFSLARIPAGRA